MSELYHVTDQFGRSEGFTTSKGVPWTHVDDTEYSMSVEIVWWDNE